MSSWKRSLAAAAIAWIVPAAAGAGERLALVASEAEGKVVIVDLESGKATRSIPTGKVPHAMAIAPGGKIFVNNRGSKELTIIDGASLEPAGTVPLPATSFQLAMSPDGRTLAVAYKDALALSLLDASTNAVLGTVELGTVKPCCEVKGPMTRHPYWSRDGRSVYVADAVNGVIARIDAATRKIARVVDIGGVNHYLHPSPDGKLLYAVNEKGRRNVTLTLIDAATDQVVKDLTVALSDGETSHGHHGTFTRDGRHFLLCNEGGHHVAVLDVARREWVKTIETGEGPGHAVLSPDGKTFFVVHHHDRVVTVIDAARLEAVKNVAIGEGDAQSHAAWFSGDGRSFYVVASGDGALVKIDVARMEVAGRTPVGGKSFFFAVKDGASFPATE